MRKPVIGILAGMGPRSTTPFLEMVLDECQGQYGASFDIDYPKMVVVSLPTPFYPGQPLNHREMEDAILAGLVDLAATGVDFIAMPCNTAHLYYEKLRQSINIPLLNIVEETIRSIPAVCKRPALLATGATVQSGIYQKGLKLAGKSALWCEEWQSSIDRLLGSIKQAGDTKVDEAEMACLLEMAAKGGADAALIACTDLTSVVLRCNTALPIIDSAQCLARATVKTYLECLKEQL